MLHGVQGQGSVPTSKQPGSPWLPLPFGRAPRRLERVEPDTIDRRVPWVWISDYKHAVIREMIDDDHVVPVLIVRVGPVRSTEPSPHACYPEHSRRLLLKLCDIALVGTANSESGGLREGTDVPLEETRPFTKQRLYSQYLRWRFMKSERIQNLSCVYSSSKAESPSHRHDDMKAASVVTRVLPAHAERGPASRRGDLRGAGASAFDGFMDQALARSTFCSIPRAVAARMVIGPSKPPEASH